jgi:acyl carrier protein
MLKPAARLLSAKGGMIPAAGLPGVAKDLLKKGFELPAPPGHASIDDPELKTCGSCRTVDLEPPDLRGSSRMSEAAATTARIKRLIVDSLNLEGVRPEMIEDEAPLFGEGLGLDSVDALELVVALEKEFGIRIKSQEIGREVFSSVSTLSQFIEGRT